MTTVIQYNARPKLRDKPESPRDIPTAEAADKYFDEMLGPDAGERVLLETDEIPRTGYMEVQLQGASGRPDLGDDPEEVSGFHQAVLDVLLDAKQERIFLTD